MNWQTISEHISNATGKLFQAQNTHSIGGGDINSAYCLQDGERRYFVKTNRAELVSMFEAEFFGLQELANTNTVRVPNPITYGQSDRQSFIVLEHLELGRKSANFDRVFGEQLAKLHQLKQPYYGWQRNNTIGSSPQPNNQESDWLIFWQKHRLGFQLKLAAKHGYHGRLQTLGEKLSEQLPKFFKHYSPVPSLLHGDLWAGNATGDAQGLPVMFDPACYYGDREADLAMTELFGGFGRDFYAAYNAVWALDDDYNVRKTLYNLYHILNHLNLFGGGYGRQAENMMEALLAL